MFAGKQSALAVQNGLRLRKLGAFGMIDWFKKYADVSINSYPFWTLKLIQLTCVSSACIA